MKTFTTFAFTLVLTAGVFGAIATMGTFVAQARIAENDLCSKWRNGGITLYDPSPCLRHFDREF